MSPRSEEPKQNMLAPMTPEQRESLRQEMVTLERQIGQHEVEIAELKDALKAHRDQVQELRDQQREIANMIDE